ncbi:MAG: hypothetical protein RI897_46 [Verrucomicrobiota bacterium]
MVNNVFAVLGTVSRGEDLPCEPSGSSSEGRIHAVEKQKGSSVPGGGLNRNEVLPAGQWAASINTIIVGH